MITLGIESSCDETACALLKGDRKILSNIVASQIDIHNEFGGVVPELACRRHIDLILPVLDEALLQAKLNLNQIDLISVTYGPGLIGALLIGLNTAKAISMALKKPFIGVNHIEAHLYASLMSHEENVKFPCLGLVVSGGHTALVLIKAVGHYELIGQTVDDAVGEAFDKVAKLLSLRYPGGPEIEKLAKEGNPHRFPFKGGQVKGYPFHFSLSGIKTAVLYTLRDLTSKQPLSHQERCDLAASFQRAVCEDIVHKTLTYAHKHNISTIIFGGGVTNNRALRQFFVEKAQDSVKLLWPSADLSLDNAAMIAGLGSFLYSQRGYGDSIELEPLTRIPF